MRIILTSLLVICGLNEILARSLDWNTLDFNYNDYEDDSSDTIKNKADNNAFFNSFKIFVCPEAEKSLNSNNQNADGRDQNVSSDDENEKDIYELINLLSSLYFDENTKSFDNKVNVNTLFNNYDSQLSSNEDTLTSVSEGNPNFSEEINELKNAKEELDTFLKELDDSLNVNIPNYRTIDDADQINVDAIIKNIENDDNGNIFTSVIIGDPNTSEETNEHKDINDELDKLLEELDDMYNKIIPVDETKDDTDTINVVESINNIDNDDSSKNFDKYNNDNSGNNKNEEDDTKENEYSTIGYEENHSDNTDATIYEYNNTNDSDDDDSSLNNHEYELPTSTIAYYNFFKENDKYDIGDPIDEYELLEFKSLDSELMMKERVNSKESMNEFYF